MNSSLFRRTISKKFSRTKKTFFAALLLGIIFFSGAQYAHAGGYDVFKTLFGAIPTTDPITGNSTPPVGSTGVINGTTSGIQYKGVLKKDTSGVSEFYFGLNLIIPGLTQTDNDKAKNIWDYVAGDGNGSGGGTGTFLVRWYKIINGQKTNFHFVLVYENPYTKKNTSYPSLATGIPTTVVTNTSTEYGRRIYSYNKDTDRFFINQAPVYIPVDSSITYDNSQYGADFWYCGGESGTSIGDTNDIKKIDDKNTMDIFSAKNGYGNATVDIPGENSGNTVSSTTDLCGGTSYFKIGSSINFTFPQSAADTTADISASSVAPNQTTSTAGQSDGLPTCGVGNTALTSGTIVGCVAQIVYYLVYIPISFIAGLIGKMFDFFIGFSVSDQTYRYSFAVTGWKVVRDLSNIFFIIILVYSGFMAVFKTTGPSLKKVIPNLIISALIINFSLIATRTVIDLSNIVTRIFYSRIYVCDGPCTDYTNGLPGNIKRGTGGYWPLSEKIVSSFNPQAILSTNTLNGNTTQDFNSANNVIKTSDLQDHDSYSYAGYFIIVTIVGAFIMFAVGKMFWGVAFMFLGRVVGLYACMIFSPAAFLSIGKMPIISNIEFLSWDNWLSEITNYALLAPIFVLFLYIIYGFLGSQFAQIIYTSSNSGGFIEATIKIILPMFFIYMLINYGAETAKKYAGKFGTMAQQWGEKVSGTVIGAGIGIASGGAALAGRGIIGAGAKKIQTTDNRIGNWINRNQTSTGFAGWVARKGNSVLDRTQNRSFDVRNSKAVSGQLQNFAGQFNVKLKTDNALLSAAKLGSKDTAGGIDAYDKRKDKETKARIDVVKTNFKNDKEAISYYDKLLEKERSKEAKKLAKESGNDKLLENRARAALEKKKKEDSKGAPYTITDAELQQEKAAQKTKIDNQLAKTATFEAYKNEKVGTYGKVKNNETLTQAMRLRYADNIKEDPVTAWNTIRRLGGVSIPDAMRERSDIIATASKYGEDSRKKFKSEEKEVKELESINATLNNILSKVAENNTSFQGFKNKDGKLDHKEMSGDERYEMIKIRKTELESKLETEDVKVSEARDKFKAAKAGPVKDRAEKVLQEAVKNKMAVKNELDEAKDILHRQDKIESKIEGKKKEKEKEKKDGETKEKAKEPEKEKPKEEKKP